MKALFAAMLGASLVSGCAWGPLAHDNPAQVREIPYACSNGQSLTVRFFPEREIAVLVRNDASIELRQQPSGSGFIYGNGPNTIRGKGDDLTVEIGRMVPWQCKAKRPG